MHIHVVLNPAGASGRAWKLWKKLKPQFDDYGDYTLHTSSNSRGVQSICEQLTSSGALTAIALIGGDGTLNEAINGIRDFDNTLFGFVPCGTGNDAERDMSLPRKKKDIVSRLLSCEVRRRADIGELSFYKEDGSILKRKFSISSDIGFGAAACAFADRSKLKPVLNKLGLGKLIYLVGALKVCFGTKTACVRISYGGKTRVFKKCLCAIVMNHAYEGGGFKFCPDADFCDGKLDICVGNGISKPAFLKVLPLAYKGMHKGKRGIFIDRAQSFSMTSDIPLWAHTDGEVLGMTRKVNMRLTGEKLNLIV